jgi:metal-responsive CopG/Arc/MetJ family transcriptional regulator
MSRMTIFNVSCPSDWLERLDGAVAKAGPEVTRSGFIRAAVNAFMNINEDPQLTEVNPCGD